MVKKAKYAAVFLLLLFIGLNSFVITRANEYTLVKQFGKVMRVENTSGLSFKIPFVQSTQRIPRKKMIYDLIPSDVTTRDKKVMNVDSFVIWEITDPIRYLSSLNASIEKAEVRLDNVVYNSIKTVMSATSQEDIISGRAGELANAITNNIGTSMDSYGIHILAVETKKLDLPDSNKESVYQRMISERNNIAAQYTADGDYQSSLIRNETDKTTKETVAKAEAEAEMIKAEGEAQYMQILSNAYNDESKADFYNYVRSLDALKSSLKGTNKTIILNKNSELARILSGN
ncbi:protease modulator HflC [Lacrimispora saccharolytica]|uniref:Protein HflC n=1 Tax=Lacrimispora saccharolytica (strain ATCC 35040 / DSM 2544 / NRCC 2533 / WM1) TaxID=610130 RepID=D9R5X2_LACSW|nr:protease modulator HflC [Lacrimispora saccharolytica]ADL03406.1 band 7 protein [[Clostridium] saccharolyticum WM1]QRV18442.1 protease modulator HflC [Lacrimispora saccharolytica]